MNWGKTKTLLIVLLIAANLIAAFMYARLRYDKTMLPEEIVDGAVENLTSKGVKVQDGRNNAEKTKSCDLHRRKGKAGGLYRVPEKGS